MPDEPEVWDCSRSCCSVESRRASPHHPGRRPRAAGRAGPRPAGIARSSPRARPSSGSCLRRNQPGPYQIQAAINAVHSRRPDRRRHRLGADPAALRPAPRARPEPGRGPQPRGRGRRGRRARQAALDARSISGSDLDGYYLFHAIRADLLRRLGRTPRRRWRTRRRSPAPTTRPSAPSCGAVEKRSPTIESISPQFVRWCRLQ